MSDHAILTGDLVRSTSAEAGEVDRAMRRLADAARRISGWPGGGETRFTRFRGDGWQIAVAPPARALRAALVLAATLRACKDLPDTRIAIGAGAVDTLGTRDLSDGAGLAFNASGRALERIGRGRRLNIGGAGLTPLHRAVVDLLDERTARHSPEQAQALALFLDPAQPTQTALAERLGISPQAMSYRLKGAGADAILSALAAWEEPAR